MSGDMSGDARVEIRRIRPDEHAAAGEVCVAAYEPFHGGAEDDYRDRLRDVATRDAAWTSSPFAKAF